MTHEKKPYESLGMLKQHRSMQRIAVYIILLFVILFFILAFVPWQQTASGYGKTFAFSPNERQQIITAPLTGLISKWYVHDGSTVRTGDPIVEITDNDPNLLKRLKLERNAILLRQKAMKNALATAEKNVKRQKLLFTEGISSRRKYEMALLEYNQYENKLATILVDLTKINSRIARQETQLVKADASGTILQRVTGEGSIQVKQGDKLAVLIPKTKSRVVELWMSGLDIPLIRKDQAVRLQFEGWPAIQFSGWPSVAVGTFGGKVYSLDPVDNGQGMFRIIVVPEAEGAWPGPKFLRQGVRAQGWVLLNRVPLWYEIWRRFNNFPPTIEQAKPMKTMTPKIKK